TNWVPFHTVGYDSHSDIADFMRGYRQAMGDPFYYNRAFSDFTNNNPNEYFTSRLVQVSDLGTGFAVVAQRAGGATNTLPLGIMETSVRFDAGAGDNDEEAYIVTAENTISMDATQILLRTHCGLPVAPTATNDFFWEFGLTNGNTNVRTASHWVGMYFANSIGGTSNFKARTEANNGVTTVDSGVNRTDNATPLIEILITPGTSVKYYI